MRYSVCLIFCFVVCYGETELPDIVDTAAGPPARLHNGLTEKIGNFSIELLYHTAKLQPEGQNMIMSPFTVWTVLAVISEGASGNTRAEISHTIRIPSRKNDETKQSFREIAQWLHVNTTTVELSKFNSIFIDTRQFPLAEFKEDAKQYYETEMLSLDFSKAEITANLVNSVISNLTHGRLPKIVDSDNLRGAQMVLTSALYFKGQWTVPFNASSTMKQPFYDSNGKKLGEVNMMYNRYTYPFSNIKALQARVIELPYGKENRLSLLIMLPNPGVSLEDMFFNFQNVSLDSFFEELRLSKEEYSDDEVDCFLPRFKIKSDLDLTEVLKNRMGIKDLFDAKEARLPHMSRTPLYVSKAVHKAEIEVTEEGTTASAVTVAEFANRIGAVRFEANRPFTYIIVEKVTNSIVFGGFYKMPTLY